MTDVVNHPPHYRANGIEVIDVIEAYGLGFHLGNVVKYILRAGRKGYGDDDLRKARWYLDRKIEACSGSAEPASEQRKSVLHYLATPYTKTGDIHGAFCEAARIAAALLKAGHEVYSPIVSTHPLAVNSDLDPLDHSIWLPINEAMMARCDCLLVAHIPGWSESKGVAHEIEFFTAAGKPIAYLDPHTLEFSDRPRQYDQRFCGVPRYAEGLLA
jgi:hypothetical protein